MLKGGLCIRVLTEISLPDFLFNPSLQMMVGCTECPCLMLNGFYLFLQDFSAPEELDLLWRAVKMPESCSGIPRLIRNDLSQIIRQQQSLSASL